MGHDRWVTLLPHYGLMTTVDGRVVPNEDTPAPPYNANGNRPPPSDPHAELALLAHLLVYPHHLPEILAVAPPEHFYTHRHLAAIYAKLGADRLDIPAIESAAPPNVILQIGGHDGLLTLQSEATTTWRHHAEAVADTHRRRETLGYAQELRQHAFDGTDPTDTLDRLNNLSNGHHDTGTMPVGLIDWPRFWNPDEAPDEWLIEPLLPAGRGTAIYSTAKAGKSVLALEIAAALATGRPVLDQPARPPQPVLYVDYEMTEADLREHLTDMGYGPQDPMDSLYYLLSPSIPALDTRDGGNQILSTAHTVGATLVVIDTYARAIEGPENDSDTVRAFYRHTGARLKAAGIAMLRLDHAGKDVTKGQRGSSGKNDDVDLVWRMTVDGTELTTRVDLKRTHSRVAWVPTQVILTRHGGDRLHHTVTPNAWPDGTGAVSDLLEEYAVPLDATVTTAAATLRAHGHGARRTVVAAALKFRRTSIDRIGPPPPRDDF